jgi:hypothetical protein
MLLSYITDMQSVDKGKILLMFSLALLLAGCSGSRSFVSFEVLEPAAITYPETVSKVGYLNRAPLSRDAFSKVNQTGLDPIALRIVDSTICNNLRRGFHEGQQFTELTYLEEIPLYNSRRTDTTGKASLLDGFAREQVFHNAGSDIDALVVLEYYYVNLEKSYPSYDFMVGDYIEEFRLNMDILWRVYAKDRASPVDEYLQQDTLFYMNRQSLPSSTYLNPADVLRDGSQELGFRYGLRHIPKWTDVSRVIFRGGSPELRAAAELTDRGAWDEAAGIWVPLIRDENPKIAARACHNLAVHYELLDDLVTASNYIKRANELWDNETTGSYSKVLEKRMNNQEKLLKQVR